MLLWSQMMSFTVLTARGNGGKQKLCRRRHGLGVRLAAVGHGFDSRSQPHVCTVFSVPTSCPQLQLSCLITGRNENESLHKVLNRSRYQVSSLGSVPMVTSFTTKWLF